MLLLDVFVLHRQGNLTGIRKSQYFKQLKCNLHKVLEQVQSYGAII